MGSIFYFSVLNRVWKTQVQVDTCTSQLVIQIIPGMSNNNNIKDDDNNNDNNDDNNNGLR